MKRKIFFIFLLITSFFLIVNHKTISADEGEDSNISIEGLKLLQSDGKYYTNKRTVRINLELNTAIYANAKIIVCQLKSSVSGDRISLDACREFPSGTERVDFQISDYGDGEKYIEAYFKSSINARIGGEESVKSFVLDTQGPTINVSGDKILKLKKGADFSISTCSAVDESEGAVSCIADRDSISTQEYGAIYNVVYSATDFLGNTSTYKQTIIIEDKPAWQPNTKVIVGVVLGLILIGAYIYIKIWQKKEKEKKKEEFADNKFHNSKLL